MAFTLAHFQILFLFFGMGLYLSCFYNLPSFLSFTVFVFFIFLTLNAMMDEIFIMRKNIKKLPHMIGSREIMFEHPAIDRTPKQFNSIQLLQEIGIVTGSKMNEIRAKP